MNRCENVERSSNWEKEFDMCEIISPEKMSGFRVLDKVT